jgi:hypothetical protein
MSSFSFSASEMAIRRLAMFRRGDHPAHVPFSAFVI